MHTTVQKWGNSIAFRIPGPFAKDAHIKIGSVVDVTLQKGKIVVTPAAKPVFSLDSLLKQVSKKNLHAETETGTAMGHEAW